ncbi:MAG: heme peroxidase [Alphaproteobacteria bacterium]|nr:heme peroxidase [Alphaproteobacteria bacterium]
MLNNWPRWIVFLAAAIANRWPWLRRIVNRAAVNSAVNSARRRPHIYSTYHDYVSWTSLTDQTWSARHLPPGPVRENPTPEAILPLFQRTQGQVLSDKSTCLFPAFAQYLTDGFIRTRMPRSDEPVALRRRNTSNHNIDLCPLYGRTPEQTLALRARDETQGRRGRLKSQIVEGEEYAQFLFDAAGVMKPEFAALDEPLGLNNVVDPVQRGRLFAVGGDRVNTVPQVATINTLFLREHNRVAAAIERGHPTWDDERVFQTARNVVVVCFIKIVVEDYINHISPTPFKLYAEPSIAWLAPWNKPNWITAEFSLLYRWHALIPDDMVWSGTPVPVRQTFMNNGYLLDAGLARAITDLSAQKAGKVGPFNTAEALKHVELASIQQDRDARLQPYAAYREYVKLKPPKKWRHVSRDKRVQKFLSEVYADPGDIDFFVGLFSEDLEINSPLPPLILKMVALDAFSQALTNPLLSEHAFCPETFSDEGWEVIQSTSTLRDVLARNATLPEDAYVGMTQKTWRHRWW